MKIRLLAILLMALTYDAKALTFTQAKIELKKLYVGFPNTFYCDCRIDWISTKKLVPLHETCGYTPRKATQMSRARRVEFEHVVSAWEFGHQRQCWQKGKRRYCADNDKLFQEMEGDLHNLVPAIGEINGDRSNFRYGLIEKETRVYGRCDAEVDFKRRIFEPSPAIRGDIARIYFYFESRYGFKIGKKQKKLFTAWDAIDPVSEKECRMELEKSKIQGNSNQYVRIPCNSRK